MERKEKKQARNSTEFLASLGNLDKVQQLLLMLTNAKAIQFICKISGQNGSCLGLQQGEAVMSTAGRQ